MTPDNFNVWRSDIDLEREAWLALWGTWSGREVFAHPGYVDLYTSPTVHACCAVYTSPFGNVIYPFLLRDLTVEAYWKPNIAGHSDIITPYGYGGPFTWNTDDRVTLGIGFWKHFDAWAIEQGVVSEFVRFHLFDETLLDYPGLRTARLKNVVRYLELDPEALWHDVRYKVRKNVNRARQNGVEIVRDPTGHYLDDFLRIYLDTMERREAALFYHFPREYFERLQADLPGQFTYFHAMHQGRIVSTELVLLSEQDVYSFLGGTDRSAFALRPNDLLKFEVMLWAHNLGKRSFVLGGGYHGDDSVYEYKATFAPNSVRTFYTGQRIILLEAYDQLARHRRDLEGNGWEPTPDYFPIYRA